jgi:sortase A
MTDTAVVTAPPGTAPGEWWRTAARGLGQLLITIGVVILLFVGYELWGTGLYTKGQQHQLTQELERLWKPGVLPPAAAAELKNPKLGSGIAILRIPRLGKHWVFVIVEGTGFGDLQKGPGHYPGTAMPGQVGNFAVAGHRTTYLHPFYNLDRVRSGDLIYIETRSTWFIYKAQNIPGTPAKYKEIVDPSAVEVAFPVPDQPDPSAKPRLKVLTFTTCNPRYSAAQRLVIHAELVQALPRSAGNPPGLVG